MISFPLDACIEFLQTKNSPSLRWSLCASAVISLESVRDTRRMRMGPGDSQRRVVRDRQDDNAVAPNRLSTSLTRRVGRIKADPPTVKCLNMEARLKPGDTLLKGVS